VRLGQDSAPSGGIDSLRLSKIKLFKQPLIDRRCYY
jgi:hypothetical protein